MKFMNDLFKQVVNGKTASDLLCDLSPQQTGHTGEAILRLLVLLGIHPTDHTRTVVPYRVNTRDRRLESISTFGDRLRILRLGQINSGGANKIDVCWRDGDSIMVCSSKIGMMKVKAIADLEIVAMLAEFTESGGYTMNGLKVSRDSVVPYVLVPSREDVLQLASRAGPSNRVSKENLLPLDVGDLDRMCAVLRERLNGCPARDAETALCHLMGDTKPALRMRFHQRLLRMKIRRMIQQGATTALLGALPRSGKTFIGADVVKDYKRILTITTRPTETSSQWKDVFETYRDFSGYTVMDLDGKTSEEVAERCKAGEAIVAIASIQFLKMGDRVALDGLEWDIVLVDEIHAGGSTERSDDILDRYIGPKAIRIMMTATYTKPVAYYAIPEEHCCFWDLEDVRLMRMWGEQGVLDRLCEKYGRDDMMCMYEEMLASGETDATIRACYVDSPRLGIMTTTMQRDTYDQLRMLIDDKDSVYGFSMRSLFMPTNDGRAFQNPRAVDAFLALVSGSNHMRDYKKGNMSMFARIRRYWQTVRHREDGGGFMTQMWFLPSGQGQLLEDVKGALLSRIGANPVLKNYATMTLDAGMKDVAKTVKDAVEDARATGKMGLIILTGNVGSLGISLPDVDVAFLLHDVESADMTYQQMMRVLTDMLSKTCGLVVDFNVSRILTTLTTYAASRCGKSETSTADRIRWCVSHLVDVDPDLWECPESPLGIPRGDIAEELVRQWRTILERTGCSLQQLARTAIDLGEDQRELDRIAKYIPAEAGKMSIEVNPEQEALPSGIERREKQVERDEDEDGDEKSTSVDEEEDAPMKGANLNDILARLIPEIALLSGCKSDLLEAIRTIAENPAQRAALNEFLIQMNKL
jgi:superfamily II DNA or RNA helicase